MLVGTATKQCLQNGTWYKRDGLPWTDYTRCLDKSVSLVEIIWTVSSHIAILFLRHLLPLCYYRKKSCLPYPLFCYGTASHYCIERNVIIPEPLAVTYFNFSVKVFHFSLSFCQMSFLCFTPF